MWLVVKKLVGYIVILVAASLFGYELLPGNGGSGTKELPAVNQEVKELLAARGKTEAEQQKNYTATPLSTPTPPSKPDKAASDADSESTPAPAPAASSDPSGKSSAADAIPAKSLKPSIPKLVHLNAAGIKELSDLPRIGETRAKAIIEYRQSHGGFKSVDELEKVKGIGTKTLELLRPYVTVN